MPPEPNSNQVSVAPTTPLHVNGHGQSEVNEITAIPQQAGEQSVTSFDYGGFRQLEIAMEKVLQFDKSLAFLRSSITTLEEKLHDQRNDLIAGQAERASSRQEVEFLKNKLQQEINQRLDFPGTTNS